MPKIREYQQQVQTQGPFQTRRATAEDVSSLGSGLASIGNAIGNVQDVIKKRAEQSDISELNAKMSKAYEDFTINLQQKAQQGSVDQKQFMQEYDTYMGSVEESINTGAGKEFFHRVKQQQHQHLSISAFHEEASLAGVKAKENHMQAVNNFTSTLVRDPSLFPSLVEQNDLAIDSMVSSGGLPAEIALKLKTSDRADLAKNAIRGWVKNDPESTKKELDAGKWDMFIDGDTKKQMYGEVHLEINGREADKLRIVAQKEKEHRDIVAKVENGFIEKLSGDKLTKNDVLNSPLDASSKEHYLKMITAGALNAGPTTGNSQSVAIFERIAAPEDDPYKIRTEREVEMAYIRRQISREDLNWLRAEVQGKHTSEGQAIAQQKKSILDIAKSRLTKSNPLIGLKDPEGDALYAKYLAEFNKDYSSARAEGKTNDQLLNQDSPDFLGKKLDKYNRSANDIMKSISRSVSPSPIPSPMSTATPTAPRMPNESAADYLKRTGK